MSCLSRTDIVAVIGAGAMGAGIAQVAAQAGHQVLLFDAKEGAAEKGREGVLVGRLEHHQARDRIRRAWQLLVPRTRRLGHRPQRDRQSHNRPPRPQQRAPFRRTPYRA